MTTQPYHISRIRVKGYGPFEDVDIALLDEKVEVITGESGTGKTSIARMIETIAGPIRSNNPVGRWFMASNGFHRGRYQAETIETNIVLTRGKSEIEYETSIGTNESGEHCYIAERYRDGDKEWQDILSKEDTKHSGVPYTSLKPFEGTDDPRRTIANTLGLTNRYRIREVPVDATGLWTSDNDRSTLFMPDGSNLPSILAAIKKQRGNDFDNIQEQCRKAFPPLKEFLIASEGSKHKLAWIQAASGQIMELQHTPQAALKAFRIITLLSLPHKNLQDRIDRPKSIGPMIIEDIDMGLDQACKETVAALLKREDTIHQVIVTAHNKDFIDMIEPKKRTTLRFNENLLISASKG